MKVKYLTIILFFIKNFKCQVNYNPQFSRSAETTGTCYSSSLDFCEEKVKVIDEKPFSCNYNGNFHVLYPVIVEEFNYKEDVPNNWMFNRGDIYDDGEGGTGQYYGAWYGPDLEAYNNGNFDVINGKAYLRVKKENRYNVPSGPGINNQLRNYKFTNCVLYSKFYISGGTIITNLKLPNNPYMWPALWLVGKGSPYLEIDVFEFYDNNFNNNF